MHALELQSSGKRRLYFPDSSMRAALQRRSSRFIPPGQRSAAPRSGPHLNLHVGFHARAFKEKFPRSRGRRPRGESEQGYFHARGLGEKSRRRAAASRRSALQVQAIPDKSSPVRFLEKPNEREEAVKSAKRRRKWALQRGCRIKARGDVGGESRGGFQARRNLIWEDPSEGVFLLLLLLS